MASFAHDDHSLLPQKYDRSGAGYSFASDPTIQVGNPYLIALRQSGPSGHNRRGNNRLWDEQVGGTTTRSARPTSHLLCAFHDEFGISLAGVIVRCLGVGKFRLGNFRSLLSPALVYCGKTPLGALTRRANRFSVHQYENGVSMRRTQDASSEPTAVLDRHVKGYIVDASVRHDILASNGLP